MLVKGNVSELDPDVREHMSNSNLELGWVGRQTDRGLAIGERGLGLFEAGRPPKVMPWSEIAAVDFSALLVTVTASDRSREVFALATRAQRGEIIVAMPISERERLGLEAPPPAVGDASGSRPAGELWSLLTVGVILQFIGGAALGWAWEDGGLGIAVGALAFSAGSMVALVALIGFGTMLGMQAARASDSDLHRASRSTD